MSCDLQQIIGNTLRWGVTIACATALVGGCLYLGRHGGEAMPDYTTFDPETAARQTDYTTLAGIWEGGTNGSGRCWVQMGVIILLLTPIMRVVLSLVNFLQEHDWLYAFITAFVLATIISNSIGGF